MSSRIVDRDHGYAALKRRVFGFGNPKISVGILAADGDEPKKSRDGDDEALTLIEVAVYNEFGGPNGDDPPARPFIRGWFDGSQAEIRERLRIEMQGVIAGKRTKEQALERVALWAVAEIQKRIADGIEPENADSTIRRKGSSTPLVDTGQLRSAPSYRIEE